MVRTANTIYRIMFISFPGKKLLIGGDDYAEPGVYRWFDGSRLTDTFNIWKPGQPDRVNEHCLEIWPWSSFQWNNGDCAHTSWSICEYD